MRWSLFVDALLVIQTVNVEVPAWHSILVMVNSPIDGGGASGKIGVFSLDSAAEEAALHELGHVFGLADEYGDLKEDKFDVNLDMHPPDEPCEPNVTIKSDRNLIKWRDLIDSTTAIPTMCNPACPKCDGTPSPVPPEGTVGAFEGAHYYHCGAYRPEHNCKMRNLGHPFCAVCERFIEQEMQPFQP